MHLHVPSGRQIKALVTLGARLPHIMLAVIIVRFASKINTFACPQWGHIRALYALAARLPHSMLAAIVNRIASKINTCACPWWGAD